MTDSDLIVAAGAIGAIALLASSSETSSGSSASSSAGATGKLPPFAERTGQVDADLVVKTANWVWPVEILDPDEHPAFADIGQRKARISDGWRWRESKGGHWHKGADIMFKRSRKMKQTLPERSKWHDMPTGTRILAAGPGTVSLSKRIGTGGYVRIHHPAAGLVTQYIHLARRDVRKGDAVKAGDPIGVVGFAPAGYRLNHLHFELILAALEMHLDPEPYLRRWRHVWIDSNNTTERQLIA